MRKKAAALVAPTADTRPTCRGAAIANNFMGRAGPREGVGRSTEMPAAGPTGSQRSQTQREVKASQDADAAAISSYFQSELVTSQSHEGVSPLAKTRANERRNGEQEREKELPAVGGAVPTGKGTDPKQRVLQDLPAMHAEGQNQHGREGDKGVSVKMDSPGRVQVLEQMLLHLAALNRQLELELIETRRELTMYKQLLPDVQRQTEAHALSQEHHKANSAAPPLMSDERRRQMLFTGQQQQQQQVEDLHGGISGWETAARRMRYGYEEGERDALSDGEGRPRCAGRMGSPKRFLSTQPPRSSRNHRNPHAANGTNGNSHVPHSSRQKSHPTRGAAVTSVPLAASATNRRGRSMRQHTRPRGPSHLFERLDAEDAIDMLETLKLSLMYRCNHSHHRSTEGDVVRPAAKPRKGTRSVAPPPPPPSMLSSSQRKLAAAVAGAPACSVSARHGRNHGVSAVGDPSRGNRVSETARIAHAPSFGGKKCAPGLTQLHFSSPSRRATPMKKDTPLSRGQAAGVAAVAVGGDGQLEALQRRYWEQSRAILEQLENMLAAD
uniref:LYT1p n=1 Tax=Trypanosoma cruzi TaxID=5693 RepID=Q9BMK5_TRYCR|nr:LYT1p [Trypanosoma cruzi]